MSARTSGSEPDPDTTELAVILAAGQGTRLSPRENGAAKPTVRLLGLSLVERTMVACLAAGIRRFLVVVGHRAEAVQAHVERVASRRGCEAVFVTAPDWELGNGASALAVSGRVGDAPFLLIMADHLVESPLIEAVLRTPLAEGEVCLGVDRDKATVFDLEDVTRVTLSNGRVGRLGKSFEPWDAADTGVFRCTAGLFDGLRRAAAGNRHTLTDGMNELAADGRVAAVDVTGAGWLDVDTPEAYREARRRLVQSLRRGKGGEDGYVSIYLNRPVSTRLSAVLASTPVTPNQISVACFVVCLAGALLLGMQSYAAWVAGALLVQLSSVADGCDGEIARLKHLASPRGAWLDTLLDRYSDMALALAITFSYATSHPGPLPWIGGFLSVAGFLLASYVTKEFALRHGRPYPSDVLNRLKRRDVRLLVISCGALVGYPFAALLVAGALSHACVAGILVKGWTASER
ncbi:MAG: sugar phosphate nucleotidyltransferase [Phycisphaerae bacterium]